MVNDAAIERLIGKVFPGGDYRVGRGVLRVLAGSPPTLRHIHDHENVIVLRTFPKTGGSGASD